jgi:tetratricopeptide (TPR) repeat protein
LCLQSAVLQDAAGVLLPEKVALTPSPPIAPAAFPYYLQGLHYLTQDSVSYSVAMSLLSQAIERDPAAIQPRIAMADAYVLWFRDTQDKEKLAAARSILNQVGNTNRGTADYHASLGNLERAEGHYETAIGELLIAVQADPSNHIFHLRLARVYDLAHQDANAISEFQQAIQLQPRFWLGYLDFAVFHHSRGHYQEAAALLEQLITWAPDHAQGLAALGGVYVGMGRNADAERVSRRACDLKPGKTCFGNLGSAVRAQKREREAITYYEKALAFGSPSAILLVNLADLYDSLKERDKALDYYGRTVARAEEILKVNLRNSELRAILAYCLAQTGQRPRAEFELLQAMQDSPSNKNVRKYSLLAYEITGQRDKALETLRGSTVDLLDELEKSWLTEGLRRDARYPEVAAEIRRNERKN